MVAGQADVALVSEILRDRAYVIIAILLADPVAFATPGLEPAAQSFVLLVGVEHDWYVGTLPFVGRLAAATFGFSVTATFGFAVGFGLSATAAA